MNMEEKYYDERQIAERGKAFRFSLFTILSILILCHFISTVFEFKEILSEHLFLSFVWAGISVFSITSILKDAYENLINGKFSIFFMTGFLFLGLLICITTPIDILKGGGILIKDGVLIEECFEFFNGLCQLSIGSTYFIHRIKTKR
ncbi:MAG TPA: hypothetical protein PLR39_02120 [Treponemataceae bacterium]|nr:hypothetical protein [Treponemataceae bacterium]HOS29573.1 hypothetical protein [Treponemataceae bacterium]